jgi:hypothetical protein
LETGLVCLLLNVGAMSTLDPRRHTPSSSTYNVACVRGATLAVVLATSLTGLGLAACSSNDPGSVNSIGNPGGVMPPGNPAPTNPPPPPPGPGAMDSGKPPMPHSDAGATDSGTPQHEAGEAAAALDSGGPEVLPGGQTVASFTLLNTAITNVIDGSPVPGYDPITTGALISSAQVGNQLSVRANTIPSIVGSVLFDYGGIQHTESSAPYTMCGDNGQGTITNCNLGRGTYILTATPYDQANAQGNAGTPLSISFTIGQ